MIRWITDRLATGPWVEARGASGVVLLDVRDLIDGRGNSVSDIRAKIDQGVELLEAADRLIVCCDWGVSRSNAIAAGILARMRGLDIEAAFRVVIEATGETDLKIDLFNSVREAFGADIFPRHAARVVGVIGAGGVLGRRLAGMKSTESFRFYRHAELDLLGDLTGAAAELSRQGVSDILCLAQPRRPFGRTLVGGAAAVVYGAMELARSIGARVVLPSSIAVFAGADDGSRMRLSDAPRPAEDYGFSRSVAESIGRDYAARHGVELLIIRLSHVYGPGNIRPSVLVNAAERLASGEAVTLHRYRNGLPALDLIYIDDAVRAVAEACLLDRTGVVHIGSGELLTVADAVEAMSKVSNVAPRIVFVEKPGDKRSIVLDDVGLGASALAAPRTAVSDGLRDMMGSLNMTADR